MKTKIIAHRGSKSTRSENTLIAFREALHVGSDGIELDVHLSSDGEVVVIHDETVDRTTNGTGLVRELSLQELKSLDAGSWFDPLYSKVTIPTLKEVLDMEVLDMLVAEGFCGLLNIELKTDKIVYPEMSRKVYGLVQEAAPAYDIVYSSFNYDTLIEMKKINDKNQVALLFKKVGRARMRLNGGYSVEAWHVPVDWAKARLILGKPRLPLRVWTVNEKSSIQYFIRKKVAAIITDYPEIALMIRNHWDKGE
ncbi:glycerophosphodiester phosphodiesterase [Carnobacterium maltaromaticum]|uniref:glycerophosphodiester phosphodiesterase n=1 Tax=Carnobacterium maltaromaticum TaxID=2751 RepID=UPI000C77F5E9|nr:glycerophosphodiester phosphodiesterase [Carnobacterium maltaromaticum]PLS34714.1 glycerophosphodiester phosphodiesterase [Carnobacterium maltaromaticum]PLS36532.1 glycerophosphodiester phosphodiesterase [Carnobacterium maltaromaticum]PLS37347.1 glycerophosphodiester phosphodiesterase [Carnobacterium maltaromaticum]PLS43563.1 glycerophosphodiester phosphodiesterase [Carnobacterium maltaromaticum]PLS43908.1 glycerophosphodiester phosphodiesterase [Carnobacterium maltaromaticum]